MGRPTRIDPTTAEAIAYLYRPGVSSRDLAAQLSEAGIQVSHATVARYLARQRADGVPVPVPVRSEDAPEGTPANELTGLEAQLKHVDAGLAAYGASLPTAPGDVRAYKALVEIKTRVLSAIQELRPRASAEAEHLATLGAAAKAELLERVRASARADDDLRGKVRRQAEVIEGLLRGGDLGARST